MEFYGGKQRSDLGTHRSHAIRVALHIGEVRLRFFAEHLLLVEAVGAPEGAIHLGSCLFQSPSQVRGSRGRLLCHCWCLPPNIPHNMFIAVPEGRENLIEEHKIEGLHPLTAQHTGPRCVDVASMAADSL